MCVCVWAAAQHGFPVSEKKKINRGMFFKKMNPWRFVVCVFNVVAGCLGNSQYLKLHFSFKIKWWSSVCCCGNAGWWWWGGSKWQGKQKKKKRNTCEDENKFFLNFSTFYFVADNQLFFKWLPPSLVVLVVELHGTLNVNFSMLVSPSSFFFPFLPSPLVPNELRGEREKEDVCY